MLSMMRCNCFISLALLFVGLHANAQLNFPDKPKDLNAVVKDYLLMSNVAGLKEVTIQQSIKRDGEALITKTEWYQIDYDQKGQIVRYAKKYSNRIFDKIDYLHLNNKLYRAISKIGAGYLVTQYYYAGDKVNHKQFVSRTDSENMIDILALQDNLPVENYTVEKIRGEKLHSTLHIDHIRNIRYTIEEQLFHSEKDTSPYLVKVRNDANTAYLTWKYTYTDKGKIKTALYKKSKIIGELYEYSYYDNGKLQKITKKIDGYLINELEFFYGNNGLLRTCLLASNKTKELLLTDFRYTFY